MKPVKRWRPKVGERYWTIASLEVIWEPWTDSQAADAIDDFSDHNVFFRKKLAAQALNKIRRILREARKR